MNQKNGKNSIGLDICFEDLENPIDLFTKWFSKAKETEINRTTIPNPFEDRGQTNKWLYVVDEVARSCIKKYNEK